jgi:ribosomal protein S14
MRVNPLVHAWKKQCDINMDQPADNANKCARCGRVVVGKDEQICAWCVREITEQDGDG